MWLIEWETKLKDGFYFKLLTDGKVSKERQCPDVTGFAFYVEAFQELITCKSSEESSIPFTSIVEYFKIYGEGEDFDEFIYIMRRMDSAYIDAKSKKKKVAQGSNNGSPDPNKKNPNKGGHSR